MAKYTHKQLYFGLNKLYKDMTGKEYVQKHRVIDDIKLLEKVYFQLVSDEKYANRLPKKLRFNTQDYKIKKGKYNGYKLKELFQEDPEYL